MEPNTELKERLRAYLGVDSTNEIDSESMIGFFQRFRPDGQGLQGLYDGLPNGEQFQLRLQRLFDVAGDDRRPGGGRDAYFVVREPVPMTSELAEFHTTRWLEGLRTIASRTQNVAVCKQLTQLPRVRVLEGTPPKQPRSDMDSFPLLKAIKVHAAMMTDGLADSCQVVTLLREACYFTACDAMIRDYLLWPAYVERLQEPDPMAGYFELWRHGVKWRVFHDDMIDIYLPRTEA